MKCVLWSRTLCQVKARHISSTESELVNCAPKILWGRILLDAVHQRSITAVVHNALWTNKRRVIGWSDYKPTTVNILKAVITFLHPPPTPKRKLSKGYSDLITENKNCMLFIYYKSKLLKSKMLSSKILHCHLWCALTSVIVYDDSN